MVRRRGGGSEAWAREDPFGFTPAHRARPSLEAPARRRTRARAHGFTATRFRCEVRGGMRSAGLGPEAFVEIPFRHRPTLRAIVVRERPAGGPLKALPGLCPRRAGQANEAWSRTACVSPARLLFPPAPHVPPFLSSKPGKARDVKVAVRLESEPPPTSATRSTAPQGREGRWPRALPIALRWVDYAAAREREDRRIFGVEFV